MSYYMVPTEYPKLPPKISCWVLLVVAGARTRSACADETACSRQQVPALDQQCSSAALTARWGPWLETLNSEPESRNPETETLKQIVGPPTEEDLKVVPNEEVRDYIRKLPKPTKVVPLTERFPKVRSPTPSLSVHRGCGTLASRSVQTRQKHHTAAQPCGMRAVAVTAGVV